MTNNKWIVTVEEDADGNAILPFPKDLLEQMDWRENDTLDFKLMPDDTCTVINLSWEERQRGMHQG